MPQLSRDLPPLEDDTEDDVYDPGYDPVTGPLVEKLERELTTDAYGNTVAPPDNLQTRCLEVLKGIKLRALRGKK